MTFGVLKDFGMFCAGKSVNPNARPFLREREIGDCGQYGVFWYRRPMGHTKTGARHRGETEWVTEWAYVLRSSDGASWRIGEAVPGFIHRSGAEAAARERVERS